MLKMGIVGLAQVGKTTLFRILTHVQGGGLGSGRPEAHVGVVRVPDPRLERLAEMYHPQKTVHATVEFVDTPGSIIGLARTGLQIQNLRELDGLAHVVRAFEDEGIPAEGGSVNPKRDIENVELELILSDLAVVEKRLERLEKDLKKQKSPALEKEDHVLRTCKAALEKQTPLREVPLGAEEERIIRGYTFLSWKPILYVLNLGEPDAARANVAEEFTAAVGLKPRPHTGAAAICGKVEAELTELSDAEAAEFMASYGLRESAVARIIRSTYHLLGMISFFTTDGGECRAWTIRAGTVAVDAAGAVHTDIQRGFVRVEVIKFADLAVAGSMAEARHRGLLKIEGKEYVVHDGEVLHFRHAG
jgi:hypothetical protein